WHDRRVLGQIVAVALTTVVVLGMLLAAWRVGLGGAQAGVWGTVLVWWLVPIVALSFPSHPGNIAYLLLSLPAGYVLAGPILARLAGSWAGAPAALALGAVSLALMLGGEAQVATHPAVIWLDDLSVTAILRFTPVAQVVADRYHVDEFYSVLNP